MARADIAQTQSPVGEGTAGLRRALRRVERRKKLRSAALIAPAVLFLFVAFAVPIALMLFRAVNNPEVVENLPRTTQAVRAWDGESLPGEPAYRALAADVQSAYETRDLAPAARRLNYEINGYRQLLMSTGFKIAGKDDPESWKDALIGVDERWGQLASWRAIKKTARPYTLHYLLTAVDLQRTYEGAIVAVPENEAIFLTIYGRTLWMASVITLAALIMAYPLAYLMSNGARTTQLVLLAFVLLPFWTSLLVRTAAWMVVLQRQGVVNEALAVLGLVDEPLKLVYNRFGVYVGMIHILLPFMVMPLYAVMRGIPSSHLRAALSLGARPFTAFRRVYFPQTLPGIGAGCILVFVLAVGFYITPALLGSPSDQLISSYIAFYTNETINWGLASALGCILLALILTLYAIFTRLVGMGRMQLS